MGFEISWFTPSCWGDTAKLGVDDPTRRATFAYDERVIRKADELGFRNVLMPSSFVPGMDPWTLAAALGPVTKSTRLLPAVRVGEFDLAMFAWAAKSLQQIMDGRLRINIISSDCVGEKLPSAVRYGRTAEAMSLLRRFWTEEHVAHDGVHWSYDLTTEPTRTNSAPLMYFGGASELARDVAAERADCYLMWIEPVDSIRDLVADVRYRAEQLGRSLHFGLRSRVIVRETEAEARRAAADLVRLLDPDVGRHLKESSHDHRSEGVRRQDAQRAAAGADGFVEEALWTGIGVARSGVGAAITGSVDQVEAKLRAYADLGIQSFGAGPQRRSCRVGHRADPRARPSVVTFEDRRRVASRWPPTPRRRTRRTDPDSAANRPARRFQLGQFSNGLERHSSRRGRVRARRSDRPPRTRPGRAF